MELVLDSSGCVLIHEVLILINCLLMMVKWSDLVSGSCAGVARRPGPLRARAVTRRALGRSCRRGAVSLPRTLQLPDIGSCFHASPRRPRDCVG